MTIREEPFKDYRSRTSEKWKAKFEEAKKQKIKKNDDGRSYANWQTSSRSWHSRMTWTPSFWQQWSTDETPECSTIFMAVKNEYLTDEDIFKGIHDDENNVCL